jgi:integral membrane protein
VSNVAKAYRILAYVVGINLIFVIGAWIAQLSTADSSWWNRNSDGIGIVDMIHGYLFMALLVLIAVLAHRHRWKPAFIVTTMLFATIPFVSFWAEHRATMAVRSAAQPQPV